MFKQANAYVLTVSCRDVKGIVAAVSSFLAAHDCFIRESQQFGDASTGQFFMRVDFVRGAQSPDASALREAFQRQVGAPFAMDWQLHDLARKLRVLIMVSKAGHCLNDLLHRYRNGALPMEITSVVGNHEVLKPMVDWHGIMFHHMPITPATKQEQEEKLLHIVEEEGVDLVVLARYMQILSPELCDKMRGKVINIHHSFLPSFKGAKPYHQAFDRGVKIIGATAHYVTSDLDEGPIIEQQITHVDHSYTPENLVQVGGDVEAKVLAHAVQYHLEHRVLLNGHKTVVFR